MPGEFTPFLATIRSKLSGNGGTEILTRAQFAPLSPSSSTLDAGANAKSNAVSHPHGELNVEIKRDGDRISQIRIQCPCGELIELDCEY